MVIFNSYVKLPEGTYCDNDTDIYRYLYWTWMIKQLFSYMPGPSKSQDCFVCFTCFPLKTIKRTQIVSVLIFEGWSHEEVSAGFPVQIKRYAQLP